MNELEKVRIDKLCSNQSKKFDDESSRPRQITSLSVYEISNELQESYSTGSIDGILSSLQKLKEACNDPEDLLKCESFYPDIFPILKSILELKEDEGFNIIKLKSETLSILNDISPNILLDESNLTEFICQLYSLLFDTEVDQERQILYEYTFSILSKFIRRGGTYETSVKELLHFQKFLPFFDQVPPSPSQHEIVNFLFLCRDLPKYQISIKDSEQYFSYLAQIIQHNDFSDPDRLNLIIFLSEISPDSITSFNIEFFCPVFRSLISGEISSEDEPVKSNQVLGYKYLNDFIRKSPELIEFDYSIVFNDLINKDNKVDEDLYRCSIQCATAITYKKDGFTLLLENVNLKDVVHDIFNNFHSIKTQQAGVKLINAILTVSRDIFFQAIFYEELIAKLIDLLEADDNISLLSDILSTDNGAFSLMIGNNDNPDEFSELFNTIFDKNEGWKKIDEMMLDKYNIEASNCATTFAYIYSKDIQSLPE